MEARDRKREEREEKEEAMGELSLYPTLDRTPSARQISEIRKPSLLIREGKRSFNRSSWIGITRRVSLPTKRTISSVVKSRFVWLPTARPMGMYIPSGAPPVP